MALPIVVTLLGIVMLVKEPAYANAPIPMLVTVFGIVIFTKDEAFTDPRLHAQPRQGQDLVVGDLFDHPGSFALVDRTRLEPPAVGEPPEGVPPPKPELRERDGDKRKKELLYPHRLTRPGTALPRVPRLFRSAPVLYPESAGAQQGSDLF